MSLDAARASSGGTAAPPPRPDDVIPHLFAARAAADPQAPAVVAADGSLTYGRLLEQAARLAHRLRALGVQRGEPVAVRAERSTELVVMVLAVLMSGGAYLALDRRMPPRRSSLIVGDAGARFLLTDDPAAADAVPGVVQLVVPAQEGPALQGYPPSPPPVELRPEDVAYVAYTSGSTGRPKGVAVPHRAVVRLTRGEGVLRLDPTDSVLHLAPLAFDASTWEVWGTLLSGGRLVLAPSDDATIADLLELLRAQRITALWLTAGLFHRVVDAGPAELPDLRLLLAGGDVVSATHVRRALAALPGTTVVNGYGPTENTTFTCWYPIEQAALGSTVPIGRPVPGTRVYVLDERLRPVPDGEPGELYAGGSGLALSYLGAPALTASRFVADPFGEAPGERMYRTGDQVVRRADGLLEFLGRRDGQVKVRGFRVELGEVEAALNACPKVARAAVVTRPTATGDHQLVGYVVGRHGRPPRTAHLRTELARTLPDYAVPDVLRTVDELPITTNGKVDRAALIALNTRLRPELTAAYRAPGPASERAVVELWEAELDVDGVGADDDFFELGGNSLIAVSVIAAIARDHGVRLSPLDFYLNPTPAGQARLVHEATARLTGIAAGTEDPR